MGGRSGVVVISSMNGPYASAEAVCRRADLSMVVRNSSLAIAADNTFFDRFYCQRSRAPWRLRSRAKFWLGKATGQKSLRGRRSAAARWEPPAR